MFDKKFVSYFWKMINKHITLRFILEINDLVMEY